MTWQRSHPGLRLAECAALAFVALLGAQAARAQAPANTILFVGNSFTYGEFATAMDYNTDKVTDENGTGHGGVPAIFKQFTLQRGLNYNVHHETVGGQSLQFHFENKAAIIGQSKWDTVVVQGLSTEATIQQGPTFRPNFLLHAQRLEQLVHTNNPAARFYVYETWSRADQTYLPSGPWSGEPIEAMGNEIHDGYFEAFNSNPNITAVVRTGDAWLRAIVQGFAVRNPYDPIELASGKYNLWTFDSYHGSNFGYYLSALMMFGKITGEDPRVLGAAEEAAVALGITPAQAVNLQNLAHAQLNAPLAGTAFSRRTHGTAGTFDLPLALNGQTSIECRQPDAGSGYQIVFTFSQTLTGAGNATVSQGNATAGAPVLGPEPNQVTVNLSNVANGQRLVVSLTNVEDGSTATAPASMSVQMDVLVGDSGGNGTVNAADVAQTKSRSGQSATPSNFRGDLNADGVINAADIALAKSRSGTSLPVAP